MKLIITSIVGTVLLIAGAVFLTNSGNTQEPASDNNVSIVDGKQIVTIRAKGGYSPRKSTAKAGIPTVLKVETKGTFDCSSSLIIPSMKVFRNLPPSGSTEIDLGSPQIGILEGSCGMGMYPFEINFES
jgi:plastocyanin domain-containing protein